MRNLAAVEAQAALAERTLAALEEAGFHSEAFQPFAQDLGEPAPAPLSHADLAASPLADLLAGFRVEAGGRVALLTQLRGVSEPGALAARFAELDDVHYFDQQSFLRGIYAAYRSRTVVLIGLGLLAVAALLYLRYRRLRPTLATILPAVLAAALTLAVLALLGIAVNLLHLLGLLLVLSIGVDYAIFLVTSEAHTRGREAAMLSLVVACLSTCLAFGLLAASSFPALRALGTTTGLGVLLSLALAPAALVLFAPKESPKT
jgi:predicted exporter